MPFDGNDDIDVEFKSVKIKEFLQIGESIQLRATKSTQGLDERLSIMTKGPAEIEIVPGKFNKKSAIISQIQLFGQEREPTIAGVKGRKRIDLTIFNDSAGGEALYFGSTTTEDSVGLTPMPMVYRMQTDTNSQPDIDVVFHADKSIELKQYDKQPDGTIVTKSVRKPAEKFIAAMQAEIE